MYINSSFCSLKKKINFSYLIQMYFLQIKINSLLLSYFPFIYNLWCTYKTMTFYQNWIKYLWGLNYLSYYITSGFVSFCVPGTYYSACQNYGLINKQFVEHTIGPISFESLNSPSKPWKPLEGPSFVSSYPIISWCIHKFNSYQNLKIRNN